MSDDKIQLITMISNDKLRKLFDINLILDVMNWTKMSARTIIKIVLSSLHPSSLPPSPPPQQNDGREIENKSRKNPQ